MGCPCPHREYIASCSTVAVSFVVLMDSAMVLSVTSSCILSSSFCVYKYGRYTIKYNCRLSYYFILDMVLSTN
jgi:hypothetical protein